MVWFSNLVASAFEFLVADYGFQRVDRVDQHVGQSVEYWKEPITIRFGWYKGEINIDFCVSLQFAKDHNIFRPYLSRTFGLTEIVLHQDRNALASWATRPAMGALITSSDQARAFLVECARVTQQYCAAILQGNLILLEDITKQRSATP